MADKTESVPTPVEALVDLFNEMNPFLDAGGWAYVSLPDAGGGPRLVFRMDDQRVRFLLLSLYRERHNFLPAWDQVYKAMALVQGRLLKDRRRPDPNDPTLQVFLKAASEHEGWAGSAKEVLDLLRATQKAHRVVKNTHRLPTSATAVGIWLAVNQLRLQEYGVELYRPTRRSTKRLWAWRCVARERDAGDASATGAPFLVSATNQPEQDGKADRDACDTSEANLASTLQDELQDALG